MTSAAPTEARDPVLCDRDTDRGVAIQTAQTRWLMEL